jgi:hypothetical protein
MTSLFLTVPPGSSELELCKDDGIVIWEEAPPVLCGPLLDAVGRLGPINACDYVPGSNDADAVANDCIVEALCSDDVIHVQEPIPGLCGPAPSVDPCSLIAEEGTARQAIASCVTDTVCDVVDSLVNPLTGDTERSGCVAPGPLPCSGVVDVEPEDSACPLDEPPTPDLCDGDGDTWEKVYEIFPNKDALLLVTAAGVQDAGGPAAVHPEVLGGTLNYHAEVWLCQDEDNLNEYLYYGYKSGYYGGGLGWGYSDPWEETEVRCYYAPGVDAGYVPCKAWADQAPVYLAAGTLTIGISGGPSMTFWGPATWDAVPNTLSLLWVGDYAGRGAFGAAVTAKMLGYL